MSDKALLSELLSLGWRGKLLSEIDSEQVSRFVHLKLARRRHGPGPSKLVITQFGKIEATDLSETMRRPEPMF